MKKTPMLDAPHDPRSRLHRACIHVGWTAFIVACVVSLWYTLFHGGTKSPISSVILGVIGSVFSVINGGYWWMIHSKPPGQKLDAFCWNTRP